MPGMLRRTRGVYDGPRRALIGVIWIRAMSLEIVAAARVLDPERAQHLFDVEPFAESHRHPRAVRPCSAALEVPMFWGVILIGIAVLIMTIPWPAPGMNWVAFAFALIGLILVCLNARGTRITLSERGPLVIRPTPALSKLLNQPRSEFNKHIVIENPFNRAD